jgi:hypothetical protein
MEVLMGSCQGSRRSRRVLVWFAVCVGAVACATFVPRHGWDPSLGPVVPHDTFPADCSLCHAGGDWSTLRDDFTFDHERETGVALHGAHEHAACLMCHNDRGPVQQFAEKGCSGCHSDPHLGRLGRECAACHGERSWYPREVILLHDRTRFPLVGPHAAAACFRCHPGAQVGNFAGAYAECSYCHQDDFARATNPNHQLLGFAQDCARCHLPLDWKPARFDHPATFPLANGHAARLCVECHTTPNSFVGLSPDCVACHADEHAATRNPSHAAVGFGTDCMTCHDTVTWGRSIWQHATPIDRGRHSGFDCRDCHTNPAQFVQFSCIHCHDHRQSRMADKHDDVPGYAWSSPDCYVCHPDGRK